MKRCSNCDGIIKETAAVITTCIYPGEAGAEHNVPDNPVDIRSKRILSPGFLLLVVLLFFLIE